VAFFICLWSRFATYDHEKKSLQHRARASPVKAVLVIVLESIKSRKPDYDYEHRFTEREHGSGMTKLAFM
jgi:hypothetical protein